MAGRTILGAMAAALVLALPSSAAADDPPFLDWNPLLPGPAAALPAVQGRRLRGRRPGLCRAHADRDVPALRPRVRHVRPQLAFGHHLHPRDRGHPQGDPGRLLPGAPLPRPRRPRVRAHVLRGLRRLEGRQARPGAGGVARGAGRRPRQVRERPGQPAAVDERAHQPRHALPDGGARADQARRLDAQDRPRPRQQGAEHALRRRAQGAVGAL